MYMRSSSRLSIPLVQSCDAARNIALMSRTAIPGSAAMIAAHLALDRYFRFPLYGAVVFCVLSGLAVFPAWRLTRAFFPWNGRTDALVRAAVLTFAGIVLVGLILGAVNLLAPIPYVIAFALACAVAVTFRPRPDPVSAIRAPAVPLHVVMIVLPMLAFIIVAGLLASPLTLYDAVSYHLVFPARWLQDHRLSIVPTPFSDPAQAYQPANGELFFLWLLLPFHGDLLARIGQFPFLLLSAACLYAIARRSGARADHAVYAPLFLVLTRPVVEQAVGADVDLVCAAVFLASIYFGLVAVETDARRDWAMWGISLGLYLGSKYLALVYVVALLVLPLLRGVRRRALWALPGIALFGLPWYFRNWIVAGSPIYPASLKVLGFTIARGAFTREAMNNSVFHVASVGLLPAIVAHAFGAATFLAWLPCACIGAVSLLGRRRWWPGGYVLLLPVAMTFLFWFGVPDNGDSRFLLPAVVVAMVPLTFSFGSDPRRNAFFHTLYGAVAAWVLVGSERQIPMSLPWFMGDWLSLDGIVSGASLPLFAAAMVCVALVTLGARRWSTSSTLPLITALSSACLLIAIGAKGSAASGRSELLELSPTYIRGGTISGWDWIHNHVTQATIANTGNNIPYPLFGEHLSNRVVYVNLDRHADWRFHDYARMRGHRDGSASIDALAQPSGQLMPIAGPHAEASRPRYERLEGHPDAWLRNLRDAKVTHVFITRLSAYEIEYVFHNAGGFPIEDDWARDAPAAFTLVYENGEVRIYSIDSRER
jgi:hypothetical protein